MGESDGGGGGGGTPSTAASQPIFSALFILVGALSAVQLGRTVRAARCQHPHIISCHVLVCVMTLLS